MNTSASRKRNRSDNFDVNDVELLLSLVQEHTELLDSTKLELKKQGKKHFHANRRVTSNEPILCFLFIQDGNRYRPSLMITAPASNVT